MTKRLETHVAFSSSTQDLAATFSILLVTVSWLMALFLTLIKLFTFFLKTEEKL